MHCSYVRVMHSMQTRLFHAKAPYLLILDIVQGSQAINDHTLIILVNLMTMTCHIISSKLLASYC